MPNPMILYSLQGSMCRTQVNPMPKSRNAPCRMTGAQYLPEPYVMLLEALYTVIIEMKHRSKSIIQITMSPCISPFSLKFFLLQLFIGCGLIYVCSKVNGYICL